MGVEEGNRWFVVAFYGILLGIILPYTLGKWWYGTQALTKDKVLHASAGNLFREWKEDISEGGVVAATSVGEEFKETLKESRSDAGAAKVEGKVLNSSALTDADKARLKSIDDPVRRKTLALLWAYLARIELEDTELEKEKYEVAPTALLLNNSFASVTLPFQVVKPLLAAYRTSQNTLYPAKVHVSTTNCEAKLVLRHVRRTIQPSDASSVANTSSTNRKSLLQSRR